MIGFKEYLTEARLAPLYHSTYSGYVTHILKEDRLKPSSRRGQYGGFTFTKITPDSTGWSGKKEEKTKLGEIGGVSLTRSYKTARDWSGEVVLELDQLKLSHNFKIVPVNMAQIWSGGDPWDNTGGAKLEQLYEEMVLGPIYPLSKYLTGIYLKANMYENSKDPDIIAIMHHPLYKGVRKTDYQKK